MHDNRTAILDLSRIHLHEGLSPLKHQLFYPEEACAWVQMERCYYKAGIFMKSSSEALGA